MCVCVCVCVCVCECGVCAYIYIQLTHRFHDMIQECLSQAKDEGQPLSLPMTTKEELDLDYVEYEMDSNNLPVVLGSGAFGRVYSALDSITKKKLAVKEIKVSETDEG